MSKTSKSILWIIIAIIIIALIWIGVSNNNSEVVEGETIKIGAIFMLSGAGSSLGEQSRMGTDLAVEEINESGGIDGKKIEIVYQDDQSDNPTEAITAFRNLSLEEIKILLGPNWSVAAEALAPITCDEKSLMISSAGVASFAKACDYTFSLWPSDTKNSEALGKLVVERGYKNIAIIGSEQVWEKEQAFAVKRGVEENGGSVSEFIITQEQDDLTSEL